MFGRLVVWVSGVSRETHVDRMPGAHARRLDTFHDQRLHFQLAHRLARLQPLVDQGVGGVFGVHQHRHGPLVRLQITPLPDGEPLQQIGAAVGFQARRTQPFQRARVHSAHIRHCAVRAVLQCAALAAQQRLQMGVQLGVGAVGQEVHVGPRRQCAPGTALDAVVNQGRRALSRNPDEVPPSQEGVWQFQYRAGVRVQPLEVVDQPAV